MRSVIRSEFQVWQWKREARIVKTIEIWAEMLRSGWSGTGEVKGQDLIPSD